MDIFEQNEQVSSPQPQSSEEELRGTAKACHHSHSESHHTVPSSMLRYIRGASLVTGAGCPLSWCCENSIFLSTAADERVFVSGYHQRLDGGFGRQKQLWGPPLSPQRLSSPGVGMRREGLHSQGVRAEGSQAEECVWLAVLKQVPFQSRKH